MSKIPVWLAEILVQAAAQVLTAVFQQHGLLPPSPPPPPPSP